MMSKREVNMLSSLVGVKYVDGGRCHADDGGLDCWGIFREARRFLGLPVPPVYLMPDERERHLQWLKIGCHDDWIKLDAPQPYCLALFRHPSLPEHCGIVLENCREVLDGRNPASHIDPIELFIRAKRETEYYEYVGKGN